MVRDPWIVNNIVGSLKNEAEAIEIIDQEISRIITVPTQGDTHLILLLNTQGNLLFGKCLSNDGQLSPLFTQGNGTRISQEVYDVVLKKGGNYIGRTYVVNEWFITRYEPLLDHQGNGVGILYVGARESAFQALVQALNNRVALIALVCLLLAEILAISFTRIITTPIDDLVQVTQRLAKGNMSVHGRTHGNGELTVLKKSFIRMVDTLNQTQQKLVHQEKLASLGQLAAGVAHEINNSLGSILLFSNVLYKETTENDPDREDLEIIIKETTRCKNIVADLLNFSRHQQVLTQDTDLHALLEKVDRETQMQPIFESVEF